VYVLLPLGCERIGYRVYDRVYGIEYRQAGVIMAASGVTTL